MNIAFKPIEKIDLADVTAIYNYYVKKLYATFHLEQISEQEMEATFSLNHPDYQLFVILADNKTIGY